MKQRSIKGTIQIYSFIIFILTVMVSAITYMQLGKIRHSTRTLEVNVMKQISNEEVKKSVSSEFEIIVSQLSRSDRFIVTSILGVTLVIFILLFFLYKNITKGLLDVSEHLVDESVKIKEYSKELNNNSKALADSTFRQSEAIEETSSAIAEISSMISSNTESATKSQELAADSRKTVQQGKSIVQSMISSIRDIDTSSNQIMEQVKQNNEDFSSLIQIISEISDKTAVINDIVFQTKLLSFNASVEAARAGEQGKGFAVVAEEVGLLAQSSGSAAEEISQIINRSMDTVTSIVEKSEGKINQLIKSGQEKVEEGVKRASECQSIFEDMERDVNSIYEMTSAVSMASKEQAQGVHEVSDAVASVDVSIRENSTIAAETAKHSTELDQRVESVNSTVLTLKKIVNNINKS